METFSERKLRILKFLYYFNYFFALCTLMLMLITFGITSRLYETYYNLLIVITGFSFWSLLGIYQFLLMISFAFYRHFFNKKMMRLFIAYWLMSLFVLTAMLLIYNFETFNSNEALIFLFAINLLPIFISLYLSKKMTTLGTVKQTTES